MRALRQVIMFKDVPEPVLEIVARAAEEISVLLNDAGPGCDARCPDYLRKSGTASADPSCPEANTSTVAEMSASENACSLPADASERAFCALNVSVSVERPFAYDFVTASSATAALRSSDEAALNRARFAWTSSYAATTSCVACRCSFSTTCSASLLRDRAIS